MDKKLANKIKKCSSKKDIAFLNTLKFKKTPHEKGSNQNNLLKFVNKKTNDLQNLN